MPIGRRRQRVGLLAQRPRKHRGQQRKNVERDEPHGQVLAQEAGHEGNALALDAGLASSLGGTALPCLCTSQRWKPSRGRNKRGQHHDVQREEALHGEFADIRAAAQHVGDRGSDTRNRRRNLKAHLGGEIAEFVHRQQIAGEAEDCRQSQQRHAAEPAKLARLAIGLHEEDREHVHEDGEHHQVGGP